MELLRVLHTIISIPYYSHSWDYTLKIVTTPQYLKADLINFNFLIVSFPTTPLLILAEGHVRDIPTKYDLQGNVTFTKQFKAGAIDVLRKSPHFEKSLYFLPCKFSTAYINSNFKSFQLRSFIPFPFNFNPQRTLHIIIGNEMNTLQVMSSPSVQALRWKLGVVTNECLRTMNSEHLVVTEQYGTLQFVNLLKLNKIEERSVLQNQKFQVEMRLAKLHYFKNEAENSIGGTSYNIMRSLSSQYNFTFNYVFDGHQNLAQNPNGSFNGFIGDLISDKAQIAFWLAPSEAGHPFHDLAAYCLNLEVALLVPAHRHTFNWEAILHPFALDAWLLIVAVLLLSIPILSLHLSLTKSVPNVVAFSTDVVIRSYFQSSAILPKTGRSLLWIFLVYANLIGIIFNSNLYTFLTLHHPEAVPSTLNDLLLMPHYNIDFVHWEGTENAAFFHNSTNPTVQWVEQKMNYIAPEKGLDATVEMALKRTSVVIQYRQALEIYVAQNLTLDREAPLPVEFAETIVSIRSYLGMRKYSKYSEAFGRAVGGLVEGGLVSKWLDEVYEDSRRQSIAWSNMQRKLEEPDSFYLKLVHMVDEVTDAVKPFSLRHFIFVFGCWVCGNCFAIIIAIIERVRHLAK